MLGTFRFSQADKSSDSPQWSPDGQWIAFASTRSGKRNLWLLRLDGGEAEQLTDVKTGVTSFKVSRSRGSRCASERTAGSSSTSSEGSSAATSGLRTSISP